MKAGRELDALIAEKVMGWERTLNRSVWRDTTTHEHIVDVDQWQPSTQIADAKIASDKAGHVVVFAPGSSVRDGSYANRRKEWLVEIIPHGGMLNDGVWAYGETEEIARCLAALKAVKGDG